ncbi:hypothetical protein [Halothece sp. PCC 7418]|uniref:hypothetical protein n=1 Tax=Halothece sp. (strain PCC 7418) TaxID=65093 RepID=UPI0002ED1450|nr:hypothetical protein [Halothece sp. PCC 7418]
MSNPKTENLIPFEIEGEMTYLNPDSAEGKALQRIDSLDPDDPTQWITVVEEGQEIDDEALDQWLKERGYEV